MRIQERRRRTSEHYAAAADVGGLLSFWDPLDLSTLFQEIAGTTPVTANGQNVGHMAGLIDAVASADDATRPTYLAEGINGRGAVQFTAASTQRLVANAIAAGTLTGDDKPYSAVAVCQPVLDATRYLFSLSNSASTDPIAGLRTIGADNIVAVRRATVAGGLKSVTSAAVLADATPVVVGTRFNGTQGDHWKNAVQTDAFADLDVASLTVDAFTLGGLNFSGVFGNPWSGPIGRFAIYSRSLTDEEMKGVSRNFANAYGLNI